MYFCRIISGLINKHIALNKKINAAALALDLGFIIGTATYIYILKKIGAIIAV